jgi:hypothetical protein
MLSFRMSHRTRTCFYLPLVLLMSGLGCDGSAPAEPAERQAAGAIGDLRELSSAWQKECYDQFYGPMPEGPAEPDHFLPMLPENVDPFFFDCLYKKYSLVALGGVLTNKRLASYMLLKFLDGGGAALDLSYWGHAVGSDLQKRVWDEILDSMFYTNDSSLNDGRSAFKLWTHAIASGALADQEASLTVGSWRHVDGQAWCDATPFQYLIHGSETQCRIYTQMNEDLMLAFGTLHLIPKVHLLKAANGEITVFLTFALEDFYEWDPNRNLYHRQLYWLSQHRSQTQPFRVTGSSVNQGLLYTKKPGGSLSGMGVRASFEFQ